MSGGFPMRRNIIGRCLLQQLLDERHMSQLHLAVVTGIHKSQINEYCSNVRVMSLQNAKIIAHHLKCHVDDLYEWHIKKLRQ